MADIDNNKESVVNGVNGDANSSEFFDVTDFPPLKSPTTPFADVDNLHKRIASLERDNQDSESRIGELKAELEKLRVEKDAESERSEFEKKAAEVIAKRAAELEDEVARIQHELITAVNDGADAHQEIQQLNAKISDLKREKGVVEEKVNEMQLKMEGLVKKSQESEGLISGLMEKMAEHEAAAAAVAEREVKGEEAEGVVDGGDGSNEGWKGLLLEKLPVIGAVSVGVIVVGGVMCYVRSSRN